MKEKIASYKELLDRQKQLKALLEQSSINMEAEDEGVYSWQNEETEESMEA